MYIQQYTHIHANICIIMLGSLPARVLRYVSESLRALARCFTPLGKWDYTGFNPKTKIIVIEMKKKKLQLKVKTKWFWIAKKKPVCVWINIFSEFINVFPFFVGTCRKVWDNYCNNQ